MALVLGVILDETSSAVAQFACTVHKLELDFFNELAFDFCLLLHDFHLSFLLLLLLLLRESRFFLLYHSHTSVLDK